MMESQKQLQLVSNRTAFDVLRPLADPPQSILVKSKTSSKQVTVASIISSEVSKCHHFQLEVDAAPPHHIESTSQMKQLSMEPTLEDSERLKFPITGMSPEVFLFERQRLKEQQGRNLFIEKKEAISLGNKRGWEYGGRSRVEKSERPLKFFQLRQQKKPNLDLQDGQKNELSYEFSERSRSLDLGGPQESEGSSSFSIDLRHKGSPFQRGKKQTVVSSSSQPYITPETSLKQPSLLFQQKTGEKEGLEIESNVPAKVTQNFKVRGKLFSLSECKPLESFLKKSRIEVSHSSEGEITQSNEKVPVKEARNFIDLNLVARGQRLSDILKEVQDEEEKGPGYKQEATDFSVQKVPFVFSDSEARTTQRAYQIGGGEYSGAYGVESTLKGYEQLTSQEFSNRITPMTPPQVEEAKYSEEEENNVGRALIFHSSTTETKGRPKSDDGDQEERLLKELGIHRIKSYETGEMLPMPQSEMPTTISSPGILNRKEQLRVFSDEREEEKKNSGLLFVREGISEIFEKVDSMKSIKLQEMLEKSRLHHSIGPGDTTFEELSKILNKEPDIESKHITEEFLEMAVENLHKDRSDIETIPEKLSSSVGSPGRRTPHQTPLELIESSNRSTFPKLIQMPGANFLMNFPKSASVPQEELQEQQSMLAAALSPDKLKTPLHNKLDSQVKEHKAPSTPPGGTSFTNSHTGEGAMIRTQDTGNKIQIFEAEEIKVEDGLDRTKEEFPGYELDYAIQSTSIQYNPVSDSQDGGTFLMRDTVKRSEFEASGKTDDEEMVNYRGTRHQESKRSDQSSHLPLLSESPDIVLREVSSGRLKGNKEFSSFSLRRDIGGSTRGTMEGIPEEMRKEIYDSEIVIPLYTESVEMSVEGESMLVPADQGEVPSEYRRPPVPQNIDWRLQQKATSVSSECGSSSYEARNFNFSALCSEVRFSFLENLEAAQSHLSEPIRLNEETNFLAMFRSQPNGLTNSRKEAQSLEIPLENKEAFFKEEQAESEGLRSEGEEERKDLQFYKKISPGAEIVKDHPFYEDSQHKSSQKDQEEGEEDMSLASEEDQELVHKYSVKPYFSLNSEENRGLGMSGVVEVTEVAEEYEDESSLAEENVREEENESIVNEEEMMEKKADESYNQSSWRMARATEGQQNNMTSQRSYDETSGMFNESHIHARGSATLLSNSSAFDFLNAARFPDSARANLNDYGGQFSTAEGLQKESQNYRVEMNQAFEQQLLDSISRKKKKLQSSPKITPGRHEEPQLLHGNSGRSNDLSRAPSEMAEALEGLETWLKTLELEELVSILIDGGFDDVHSLINQMRSNMPVSDDMLERIGVSKPGHRARILVKLEEGKKEYYPLEAGLQPKIPAMSRQDVEALLNKQQSRNISLCDAGSFCSKPSKNQAVYFYIPSLKHWLESLNLTHLKPHFLASGFDNYEFMLAQMNSSMPLTESTLKSSIGIQKIGYRNRLLYKLQEGRSVNELDAMLYKMSQLNERQIQEKKRSYSGVKRAQILEIRTDDREESCRCAVF